MCETAAKWIDSRARLQFRFFLNVFNYLLTTNLSRRNNRSRTGPQTLLTFEGTATDSEFPLNSTFIHAILLLPEVFTRPRQDANDLFSFYDHDTTQSECAHRLTAISVHKPIVDKQFIWNCLFFLLTIRDLDRFETLSLSCISNSNIFAECTHLRYWEVPHTLVQWSWTVRLFDSGFIVYNSTSHVLFLYLSFLFHSN